jgi:hypothetical protein
VVEVVAFLHNLSSKVGHVFVAVGIVVELWRREGRDKVTWISRDLVEITTTMTRKDYEKLKRAESLEAPKKRGEVISFCLEEYLFKHDPVQRAERSKARRPAVIPKFCNTYRIA